MGNYYSNIIAKSRRYLGSLICALALISCSDIIEEDISEDSVAVVIPQSGSSFVSNNVHFKWNELKGADAYRLQIVEPSFSSINTFILDSLISGLEFYQVLQPGDYEFMLRAENSVYETAFVGPYSFSVDSVSDLTSQVVPLTAPVEGYFTNLSDVLFTWQSIYAADDYELQIRTTADFNTSPTTLYTSTGIVGTTHSTTGSIFGSEGEYSWGIRGTNQQTVSSYSSRAIYIDKTNPNDVSLTSPVDSFNSLTDTVVFRWSSGIDPGIVHAPLTYKLELDTDVGFGSFTEYTTDVDTLQLVLPTATYYWRVYALDEAGNQSAFYSSEYSVIVP